MCSLLLNTVFALHVQLARHLVAIIGKQVVVQRLLVTRNRSSNAGSVGSKHRTNLWQLVVQVQQSQSAHPLVSVVNHLLFGLQAVLVETLYYESCSIREHRSLIVVAIGMQRVHLVVFPQPAIYFVFLLKIRIKINQNGDWFTRHSPSSHSHLQALLFRSPLPLGQQAVVLPKVRALLLFPEIRTNKYDFVFQNLLQSFSTCRKYGIDTAHLVANLPTRLKNDIRCKSFLCHVILTNLAQR